MRFSNSFEVPLPPARAWAMLLDIPAVAPCLPGAELTEKVDDRSYKGKVSVRLGPMALAFAGTATFEERDEAAHRAVVKAQGVDSRGRGGANARVTFRLEPVEAGSRVLIDTDLSLSGSVAQFGRGAGIIQGVANQLTNQFAKALAAKIAATEADRVGPSGSPQATAPTAPVPSAAPPDAGSPRSDAGAVKPIGGVSLLLKAVWDSILRLFGRSA